MWIWTKKDRSRGENLKLSQPIYHYIQTCFRARDEPGSKLTIYMRIEYSRYGGLWYRYLVPRVLPMSVDASVAPLRAQLRPNSRCSPALTAEIAWRSVQVPEVPTLGEFVSKVVLTLGGIARFISLVRMTGTCYLQACPKTYASPGPIVANGYRYCVEQLTTSIWLVCLRDEREGCFIF